MIKKAVFILLIFSNFVFGQTNVAIKTKAIAMLDKGKFEESIVLLNQIKDQEYLATTTVNLYKKHLQNIQEKQFFKKFLIQDSLYKVYLKTSFIKAHGLYDSQINKYIIPPIYDSIATYKDIKMDYFNAYKNDSVALIDKNGKMIMPLSNYGRLGVTNNLIFVDRRTPTNFSFDYPFKYFTLDGKTVFDSINLNSYYDSQIPNYIINQKKGGKLQIIDLETRKIIKDNLTFFKDVSYTYNNNEIASIDIEAKIKQFTVINSKKENAIYYNINNKLVKNTDFDSYVNTFVNLDYLENKISDLINKKKNITLRENQYQDFDKYIIVKKANKFGIYNLLRDNFYKEPIYDSISPIGNTIVNNKTINLIYDKEIDDFYSGYSNAIVVKENNKYGVIDLYGKTIVKTIYDEVKKSNRDYMFYLRIKEKWGFINLRTDSKLVVPKYDYIVPSANQYVYLDAYLNQKITRYLDSGEKFDDKKSNKSEKIQTRNYKYFQDYNTSTEKPITNRIAFRLNKLYGLDDYDNKEIVPAIYSSIDVFKKNTFVVSKKDSVFGLIDENGKEIIPLKYKRIVKDNFQTGFLYVENFDKHFSIFNYRGQQLYPFSIESIINSRYYENNTEFVITNNEKKIKGITYNFNGQDQKFYEQSLLKLENDTLQKININAKSLQFLDNEFISYRTDAFVYGLYDTKSGLIIPPKYKRLLISRNNKTFFASKDKFFDTAIDNLGQEKPLPHYFNEIKSDYYFYKENDKTGVMNPDFKVTNFTYQVLKPIYEYDDNKYVSAELKKYTNQYFKFNTTTENQKMGIIKFDGTIIVPPNKYENVNIYFDETKPNNFKKIIEKYKNAIFVGSKLEKNKAKTVLFTADSKEIISFYANNATWDFAEFSESIILKSQDSIKVIDLKTKQYTLKAKGYHYQEREDGTYRITNYLPNYRQNLLIYNSKGENIVDETLDNSTINLKHYYENYISKQGSNFGILNGYSATKVPFIYQNLKASISNKMFIAQRNNKYGVIDDKNQVLLDFDFDSIEEKRSENNGSSQEKYISYFLVKKNKKLGMVETRNFKQIFDTKFDTIIEQNGIFKTKRDALYALHNYQGKMYFETVVDSIKIGKFNNFQLFKNGLEVFLDNQYKLVNQNPYSNNYENDVKEKYCLLKNENYLLTKNNIQIHNVPIAKILYVGIDNDKTDKTVYHFIVQDVKGNNALFDLKFNQILPFEYQEIIQTDTFDFLIVKKNGKFGVVNFKNQQVFAALYDEIEFNAKQQTFDCKIKNTFYKISPRNKRLYIGTEESFNKTSKKQNSIRF